MASERKTKLNDALVRILRSFLTPATVTLPGSHDLYLRDNLLALAGHGDGHVLTIGHPHWTIRPVHCSSFWSWQNALCGRIAYCLQL